ncbi:MAG: hypothetical protein V3U84_09840 [Thiotrichaceae bacterium]
MTKEMTEEELLQKQRRGAKITALIVAAIAIAIFSLTVFSNLG